MGHEIRTVEYTAIDPPAARKILQDHSYSGQRPVSREFVLFLSREMERGAFQDGTQIAFCHIPDGRYFLIDGYSRMNAIIESGVIVQFVVTHFDVDSIHDVAEIYMRLDQGRKRSLSDTYKATGLIDRTGLPDRTNVNQLGSATRWIENSFNSRGKRIAIDRHQTLIEEWSPIYLDYLDMITGVHMPEHIRKRFTNSILISVALVTLKYAPEEAREFWSGVALDEGLSSGDPRKALLKFIDSFSTGRTKDHRDYMPSLEFMKYIARIWNAWYRCEKLSRIRRSARVPGPTDILGTPYTVGDKNV